MARATSVPSQPPRQSVMWRMIAREAFRAVLRRSLPSCRYRPSREDPSPRRLRVEVFAIDPRCNGRNCCSVDGVSTDPGILLQRSKAAFAYSTVYVRQPCPPARPHPLRQFFGTTSMRQSGADKPRTNALVGKEPDWHSPCRFYTGLSRMPFVGCIQELPSTIFLLICSVPERIACVAHSTSSRFRFPILPPQIVWISTARSGY